MVQVLISTMFLKHPLELLEKMNIQSEAIIINQCDVNKYEELYYRNSKIKIYSTTERGLSRSRNLAIREASDGILIIADDDFRYADNYVSLVETAYKKNPKADGFIFGAIREDGNNYRKFKNGKLKKKNRYSVNSIRITIKKKVLIDNKHCFDERFGAGTKLGSGEDTIFISDCFNKKIIFYSNDSVLCEGFSTGRTSTWWEGFNHNFFLNRGTIFKRLSPKGYPVLIIYFLFKNFKKYKESISFFKALKLLFKGALKSLE